MSTGPLRCAVEQPRNLSHCSDSKLSYHYQTNLNTPSAVDIYVSDDFLKDVNHCEYSLNKSKIESEVYWGLCLLKCLLS